MSERNIVFVLNEYNGHGGAQRVASILAEDFKEDGHHVAVLSINEQDGAPSYFSPDISVTVLHNEGYRPPAPIEISSNLKSGRVIKVSREIKRRIKKRKKMSKVERFFSQYGNEEVFVIVVQVYGMQWLEDLLYKSNIKIIGQSHESYIASQSSSRYKRIMRYYRQVSKFLLLTERDQKHFEMQGFTNTDYIYNPSPFRQKVPADVLYGNKTITSSGRLVEDKGFDLLIEAFKEVAHMLPDWRLTIYGDGPAKRSLKELIKLYSLEDQVSLKGQVEDIESELVNSSIFVLASRAEGLPMSLIEAQSCGLPCISTDCAPGIREIVNEYKDGFVVPIDDVQLISQNILKLAEKQSLYESMSDHAYAASVKFSRSHIKSQWYDIFEELGEV